MENPLLRMYRRLGRWPLGGWLFARAVCFKAPYFASIRPTIHALEPGRCEATIPHRRAVTNHLGTVHATAEPPMSVISLLLVDSEMFMSTPRF